MANAAGFDDGQGLGLLDVGAVEAGGEANSS